MAAFSKRDTEACPSCGTKQLDFAAKYFEFWEQRGYDRADLTHSRAWLSHISKPVGSKCQFPWDVARDWKDGDYAPKESTQKKKKKNHGHNARSPEEQEVFDRVRAICPGCGTKRDDFIPAYTAFWTSQGSDPKKLNPRASWNAHWTKASKGHPCEPGTWGRPQAAAQVPVAVVVPAQAPAEAKGSQKLESLEDLVNAFFNKTVEHCQRLRGEVKASEVKELHLSDEVKECDICITQLQKKRKAASDLLGEFRAKRKKAEETVAQLEANVAGAQQNFKALAELSSS
jgi:rubredoxin